MAKTDVEYNQTSNNVLNNQTKTSLFWSASLAKSPTLFGCEDYIEKSRPDVIFDTNYDAKIIKREELPITEPKEKSNDGENFFKSKMSIESHINYSDITLHKYRFSKKTVHVFIWVCFFIFGFCNSIPYILVLSAASSLASEFNLETSLPSIITFGVVALGMFAQIFIVLFGKYIDDYYKMWIKSLFLLFGVILMGIGLYVSSIVSLISGVSMVGIGYNAGEIVLMWYMRKFPDTTTTAFFAGTGLAGIAASLIYLLMRLYGIANSSIFFISSATIPLSLIAFQITFYFQSHYDIKSDDLFEPIDSGLSRFLRCLKLASYKALCLLLHPFLSITIMVGLVPISFKFGNAKPNDVTMSYPSEMLFVCFFVGLFLGRFTSVFDSLKTKKFPIFLLFQFINLCVWIAQAKFKFIPFKIQIPYVIAIGIFDGLLYANSYYYLIRDESIPTEDKIECVFIGELCSDFGMIFAALLQLALAKIISSI